jgi:hypothetical protein
MKQANAHFTVIMTSHEYRTQARYVATGYSHGPLLLTEEINWHLYMFINLFII